MKQKLKSLVWLLPAALMNTACSTFTQPDPDAEVSEAVIDYILPNAENFQPWRLDQAWQAGGLGGSVIRAASIEHVVRQLDQPWHGTVLVAGLDADDPLPTKAQGSNDDLFAQERAWRKYCHHQLDMTPEEQALVKLMPIPYDVLSHGCNPGSLKK